MHLERLTSSYHDPAFTDHDGYEMVWGSMPDDEDAAIYSVREGEEEVARALVLPKPRTLIGYLCPPDLLACELEYFEVKVPHRSQGVGRRALDELLAEHGPLYALSSDAASGFYRAVGWAEYLHSNGRSLSQAELFVSPR